MDDGGYFHDSSSDEEGQMRVSLGYAVHMDKHYQPLHSSQNTSHLIFTSYHIPFPPHIPPFLNLSSP